jgi:spore coat polysaccharide biosynthesis protein SpsF (cytidylyltransferase family)
MRPLVVIQARAGGTRFPGKVLEDIVGLTLVECVIWRVARMRTAPAIVVAIPDTGDNDRLATVIERCGVRCFRGPEDRVLDRYVGAVGDWPGRVLRVTADCPLIEPALLDQLAERVTRGDCDFASVNLERTWPHGLDAEAWSPNGWARMVERSGDEHQEHVSGYAIAHPEEFSAVNITCPIPGLAHHRWTVDYPEDLELVRAVYAAIGPAATFDRVAWWLDRRPDVYALNRRHAICG